MPAKPPDRLNPSDHVRAVKSLSKKDPLLGDIVSQYGMPHVWQRKQTFATLVHIILEQQVSILSARATFEKLKSEWGRVTTESVLKTGEAGLRRRGVTRQKSRYLVTLAEAVDAGHLSIPSLRYKDDEAVRAELMRLPGIGEWTANVYLMVALGRSDVWPAGDLALLVALQRLLGQIERMTPKQGMVYAQRWSPLRSVAARILWHWYLSQPGAPRLTVY